MIAFLTLPSLLRADDAARSIRKAVERSTLNQPGTKPFHLKATLAPSFERDRGSNRTGEIEIWWMSPTQFRREVRSPDFHQILIVNGQHEWQKNDGDYFPEWLSEVAVALVEPVPNLEQVLKQADTGELRNIMGRTHISWMSMSSDGSVQKGMGCGVDLDARTGLLNYGGCLGWNGGYSHFQSFHGKSVATVVTSGSIEVTANVTALEDLRDVPPDFFQAEVSGGDLQPLRTFVVDEISLRKNLEPAAPLSWPALKDGPLEGAITTEIVLDRNGKARDVGSILSDNPDLSEFAAKSIWAMHFKPYLVNDEPVQVVSRITMPFKTVRPAGMENFESARFYFEHGRTVSFPAAGSGKPYILRATFQTKGSSGALEDGKYEDTWNSEKEWRREASIGKSRFVRSQHGDKRYELAEGSEAPILRFLFKALEPIPAIDTFVESDWRMKRDDVDGVKTIRVLAGYEAPDGTLDPEQARGYWFDDAGKLVKTYFRAIETRRLQFQDFQGFSVSREVRVLTKGKVGMLIRVTDISPATNLADNNFELRGHEHTRAFTDEVR